MDENQDPSVAVPPHGHPSFFRFAVLLVKNGDRQWIQEELGSMIEADSVLTQILLRLDGVPLESVAQPSPTAWVNHSGHPGMSNDLGAQGRPVLAVACSAGLGSHQGIL